MTYTAADGQGSCVGRCGESFTRGQQCTCDFSCLQHNECCQDFHATCTTGPSCKGRCGEAFRRGQLCECDPQCSLYNTCCHDYQQSCAASVSHPHPGTSQALRAAASDTHLTMDVSLENFWSTQTLLTAPWGSLFRSIKPPQLTWCQLLRPLPPHQTSQSTAACNIPVVPLPMSIPSFHGGAPEPAVRGSSWPSYSAQSLGSNAPVKPSGPGTAGGEVKVHLVLSPEGQVPAVPSQDFGGLAGFRPRPSTLQNVEQAFGPSLAEEGSEGPVTGPFEDVDLCGDSPISGLTALSNGTILIFKGKLFWAVNPVTRSVGPPQSIVDSLGVPSPIDTVFTRCNCEGNTYIIKGDQYWRLDANMVMEPGYPKLLASEFPGLTGSISAALAVPATRSRAETVYFFKEGDVMQRFTFPLSNTPSCNQRLGRFAGQAEAPLSGEINLRSSLKGFPIPVTSALSMTSPQRSEPYQHYVFSGSLFFNIKISGNLPELAEPDPSAAFAPLPIFSPAAVATNSANMAAQIVNPPHPANSIRVWLGCP
uniref:proteoglycan 4a n=1 Tax=Semicossyphus pulcher TaxID=241346 RepID=UPI0037E84E85